MLGVGRKKISKYLIQIPPPSFSLILKLRHSDDFIKEKTKICEISHPKFSVFLPGNPKRVRARERTEPSYQSKWQYF